MSLQPMIPGPDPGACPRCGEWRKAGMIHRCPAATPDPPDAPIPDWEFAGREEDRIRGAQEHAYARGFAAGRAAATPDPPTDERRPWPIAPDTVMPPRRQPVRWGSRADDPPTEIHDDPGKTKAYLAGLAAGRTEAAAASPDERLREALTADAIAAAVMEWDRWPCRATTDKRPAMRAAIAAALDTAALAAADREAPDEETR